MTSSTPIALLLAVVATPTALSTLPAVAVSPTATLRFSLTYDEAITDSFTGRVYVMLSTQGDEPRNGPRWFGTDPFFATDVEDWRPGVPLTIDNRADGFPRSVTELEPGEYAIQAVMRRNLDSPSIGRAPGTAYSEPVQKTLTANSLPVALVIDQVVEPRPFPESDRVKLYELRSDLLSDFHGRDVTMRAAAILPKGWDGQSGLFPAVYWIGGFGSSHRSALRMQRVWDRSEYADRFVRIVLDPLCYGGHHVFADSDNNGPRGRALVEEFIPYLEQHLPLYAAAGARFVSGHSSGGWSSLWLQVTYPDVFGGVWSLAPDPVDFRTFQRIDLYAPGANMYRDADGERRPIARRGDTPFGWYDEFARMEIPYGEGGQLRSFDWVFSPRGDDGKPMRLFDPATGDVSREVAEAWKRYDIRLILAENWPELGPKLSGKLHIIAGGMDTFYLESAVETLAETLDALGSDADIQVIPGADHGNFATPALRERIDREMWETFAVALDE